MAIRLSLNKKKKTFKHNRLIPLRKNRNTNQIITIKLVTLRNEIIKVLNNPSKLSCGCAVLRNASIQIPFNEERRENINSLIEHIKQESMILPTDRFDKHLHKIPIISAISGFGKTRLLHQLNVIVPTLTTDDVIYKSLYLTYNQGTEESEWEKLSSSTDTVSLFAWRVLYYYFSPTGLDWSDLVDRLTINRGRVSGSRRVLELSLKKALSVIADDMAHLSSLDSFVRKVLVLSIDEYQLISGGSDEVYSRLKSIVNALINRMVVSDRLILVPIFAGLSSTPLQMAATERSIGLHYIKMKAFSYEAAVALVRHYLGDDSIMTVPAVQRVVLFLSAVPGYLVDLIDYYKQGNSWLQSFDKV